MNSEREVCLKRGQRMCVVVPANKRDNLGWLAFGWVCVMWVLRCLRLWCPDYGVTCQKISQSALPLPFFTFPSLLPSSSPFFLSLILPSSYPSLAFLSQLLPILLFSSFPPFLTTRFTLIKHLLVDHRARRFLLCKSATVMACR